jgi:repressor LexA
MTRRDVIAVRKADDGEVERRKPGRKPTGDLSAHQLRTLRAIQQFISDHDFPPTVAELSETIGITGSSVHDQISQLIRKGYIRRDEGKSRGMAVIRDPVEVTFELIAIPLVGQVAAGQPILAEQNIVGEITVDSRLVRSGVHFALTVKGDSMHDAGIENGDIVIVRRQPISESGDIVVALLGNEATVKRLSIQEERIELRPENSSYTPIAVGPEDDMRIVGKVVGVSRRSSR